MLYSITPIANTPATYRYSSRARDAAPHARPI